MGNTIWALCIRYGKFGVCRASPASFSENSLFCLHSHFLILQRCAAAGLTRRFLIVFLQVSWGSEDEGEEGAARGPRHELVAGGSGAGHDGDRQRARRYVPLPPGGARGGKALQIQGLKDSAVGHRNRVEANLAFRIIGRANEGMHE